MVDDRFEKLYRAKKDKRIDKMRFVESGWVWTVAFGGNARYLASAALLVYVQGNPAANGSVL